MLTLLRLVSAAIMHTGRLVGLWLVVVGIKRLGLFFHQQGTLCAEVPLYVAIWLVGEKKAVEHFSTFGSEFAKRYWDGWRRLQ